MPPGVTIAPATRNRPPAAAPWWTDFDQFAAAFARWDNHFQQLSRGPFRGGLALAQLDGVQLLRISVNRVILARGAPPAGAFSLSPVTAAGAASVFRGQHLQPG